MNKTFKVLKAKNGGKAGADKKNPLARLLPRKKVRRPEPEPEPRPEPAPVASYGPPMDLGSFGRVRAVPGQRATSVELRPGMYLVTFVPEKSVEMGFLPLLVPAIVKTATKVLAPAPGAQPGPAAQTAPALPGPHPPAIAGEIAWMDAETAGELGCDGRPCRCRRN